MKKLYLIPFVLLAAVLFLIGCEGKQGPAGQDAATVCTDCHNDDTEIWAIVAQYDNSVHKNGGNFERNTPPCSRCHTSEGFIAYWETGDPGTPEQPSAIGCFTCHAPHTNYNFDRRYTDPVVLDYLGGTFDAGDGNLCAMCHQIRVPDPELPTSGNITLTSSRWGGHHGPQSSLLSGNGLYEFAGSNYDTNHFHYTANADGCPTCHMAAPFGAQAGGHTWNMTYIYHSAEEEMVTGCETANCHDGGSFPGFSYGDVQDMVTAKLDTLSQLLISANILNPANGLLNASTSAPLTITVDEAGSYLNYQLIEEDRSEGVHNPDYILNALDASIAYMTGR